MKFSKYMDSFPFPYYIVLRNIEALPRTLANLLRQVSLSSSSFSRVRRSRKESIITKIMCYILLCLFQWLELMQYSNYWVVEDSLKTFKIHLSSRMQIRHAIYIEEGLEKVIGLLGSEFFLYMKSTRNYIVINK
jgi:hypothetical protein